MQRELQKETRRQRILDAAEALIRETGSTDFSMLVLSDRAGLSPATPYNLMGSKGAILYALLNRAMDQVAQRGRRAKRSADPYRQVLQGAAAVAAVFAADPGFYRPLYRFLLGVSDTVNRPAYMDRGLEYWKGTLDGLHAAGLLPPEIDRDELGRELEIHFVGVLDLWAQQELNAAEFRAQTVYGVALMLLGLADDVARKTLLLRLRGLKKQLPRRFSYQAAVRRGGS